MSYILDALRKSERQRPPGPVPDLFSIQGPEPPQKRRLPAKALAAALVAGCAAVLVVWASFESGGSRRVALQAAARPPGLVAQAPAPEPEPTPETEVAPEPTPEPATAAEPATPEPAPDPLPVPAPGQTGQPAEAPAAAPSPMPPAAPSSPAPPDAMSESAPDPGTPQPPESPALQPPAPGPAAGEAPAPVAPVAPVAPAPVAPVDAPDPVPPDDRIVEFAELPPVIRQKLPELVISGHVWSDEAALRLLTLKDRVVREGAEAAPGVQLVQITQSGAVFVFRGWRFSVAAF